jgi:hypothetical protein
VAYGFVVRVVFVYVFIVLEMHAQAWSTRPAAIFFIDFRSSSRIISPQRCSILDHNEVFDAIRLAFHCDVPDALLREVIEKAIKDHKEETESRGDERESRQRSKEADKKG